MALIRRLVAALQDRLWTADEQAAAALGWTARRSAGGWSVEVRDPRWDRRRLCDSCAGLGHDPITGSGCPPCAGVGVVTADRVRPGGSR